MALFQQICQKPSIVWHITFYRQNSMHWTLIWIHWTFIFDYLEEGSKESKLIPVLAHIWSISRRLARINFRTAIIQSISLWFIFTFEEADIISYSDDNTPCVWFENVGITIEKLEEVGKILFEWFSNDFLEENVDKFHLI